MIAHAARRRNVMFGEAESSGGLRFGEFRVDRADERLIGPQGPVKLGNKAYRVLLLLAGQHGRLVTKDDLFTSVWDGTIVSESALTSVVKELRRALGDESRTPRYIESVYGRGYRFLAEVRACEAADAQAETAAPAIPSARKRLGRPPMLHVPPFDDSALHESRPHLAAVLREEILLALSRFRDIGLVSDAAEIPGARGAAGGEREYQLTLKLIPLHTGVRAFARLSRLGAQAIIWGDQVELTTDNLGASIDGMVRSIVLAALPRMQDDLLRNVPPQPQDAYDLYFLTKLMMRGMTTLDDARAVAAGWERLIARYPDFALAYPPLARLYNTDFCYTGLGSCGPEERRRAYELAHKALAIDPTDSHLHTVKGWCHLWASEGALARAHFDEALQLNPYNQNRLVEIATAFMFMDDLDQAEQLLDRCRKLAPFATQVPYHEMGLLHLLRGEFEIAAEHLALVVQRTTSSDLYALLAAAGSGAPDLAARARAWLEGVAQLWSAPEELDEERLIAWVLFQHPFQADARREWLLGLLRPALRLANAREAAPARAIAQPPRSGQR
jgi:DNA-binding winged helix-turn-helix (wHTH) protein